MCRWTTRPPSCARPRAPRPPRWGTTAGTRCSGLLRPSRCPKATKSTSGPRTAGRGYDSRSCRRSRRSSTGKCPSRDGCCCGSEKSRGLRPTGRRSTRPWGRSWRHGNRSPSWTGRRCASCTSGPAWRRCRWSPRAARGRPGWTTRRSRPTDTPSLLSRRCPRSSSWRGARSATTTWTKTSSSARRMYGSCRASRSARSLLSASSSTRGCSAKASWCF
mmetsp:Transcript_131651/g.421173  ORF Transcript_131651/g.421173 Transcript_131651/m.421173 type:complete len:218 (-) Transcript_131651:872-1525(-)